MKLPSCYRGWPRAYSPNSLTARGPVQSSGELSGTEHPSPDENVSCVDSLISSASWEPSIALRPAKIETIPRILQQIQGSVPPGSSPSRRANPRRPRAPRRRRRPR